MARPSAIRDPHDDLPAWVSGLARAAVLVAWVCATVAAGFMTVTYQLGKYDAAQDSLWVAFALLSVGLACDLWVGAAPILLPKALPSRPVVFVVALASFLLAVQLTAGNKVGFWGQRADARIEQARTEQAQAQAEVAALTRARDAEILVGPPPARSAEALAALVAGLEAEIAGMEAEPERWRTRLFERRAALTEARVQLADARAYEAAEARASGREVARDAARLADEDLFDPRDRWIAEALNAWGAELSREARSRSAAPGGFAAWLASATPETVETWMHGLQALFHELFCFVGLVLVGLGRSEYQRLARLVVEPPQDDAGGHPAEAVETVVEAQASAPRRDRGLFGRLFGGMDQGWRAFAREVIYDSSLIPRPEGRPIKKGLRLPGPAGAGGPQAPPALASPPDRLRRGLTGAAAASSTLPTVDLSLAAELPAVTLAGAIEVLDLADARANRAAHVADVRASIAAERAEAEAWRAAGLLAEADAREAELAQVEAELAEMEARWAAEDDPNAAGLG